MPHLSKPLIGGFLLSASLTLAEMIPFVLPWDDTSDNITNLSDTLHPAGSRGWVTVNGEEYELDGERIRFFGVNIGASSCFPPASMARPVARRMARFGLNVARFHHMEAQWANPSLIDYTQGNSRTLSPVALDRLDRFVSELKDAGVYTNLNLLTSRVFSTGDGLPADFVEPEQKIHHILAFFHEPSLELQKEHATSILDHTNPYTGLRYADDPAVAFVEINNENGLIHQWFDEGLNHLGPTLESDLAGDWNTWLAERFPNSDALREAWGAVNEPFGESMIANSDFASGTSGWNFEQHQGAEGSLTPGVYGGRQGARISTTTTGSNWHIQLYYTGLSVTEGQLYTVRFWARADETTTLEPRFTLAYDPWSNVGLNVSVPLTTEWQQIALTFYANSTDENTRFGFTGLGDRQGYIELSDIEVFPGGTIDPIPEGTRLEDQTIPLLKPSDDQTLEKRKTWLQFLRDLEYSYWEEMTRFIKEDLGYPGIVWGTTIMNSPPSAQAQMDAIDTHVYWKHPQWTGANPWDPIAWEVENESMVNDPEAGGFEQLARERIAGFPHNVTEYQHASPNTYSSEAALFLGIYASLQDWDGLYIFHYGSGSDDWDRGYFDGYFDIDQHPQKLVTAAMASLMFRRMDISPARETVSIAFDPDRELDVMTHHGVPWSVSNLEHLDVPPTLALVNKLQMDLTGALPGTAVEPPSAPAGPAFTADTGEIQWDLSRPEQGILLLDTPRAIGLIGFDDDRTFNLGSLTIDPGDTLQNWLTVTCVTTEGEFTALNAGVRGLIATTGNAENTDMGWTDDSRTSVGNQWGSSPTLVENVPVTLTFPVSAPRLSVWALDVHGNRELSLPVHGTTEATVYLGGNTGSLWYEFEVAPNAALSPPVALTLMERSGSTCYLSWQDTESESRYVIQMSQDLQVWESVHSVPANTTSAILRNLPTEGEVFFRVLATNIHFSDS